jgi:hypothetical protein
MSKARIPFAAKAACSVLCLLLFAGCFKTSTIVRNEGVGTNGSFEFERSGKPVNWFVYSKALKKNKAELGFDTEEVRDGKQSLKFSVTSCSDQGGWQSPGIYQEFAVQPNSTYRVSFWLKNNDCRFNVNVTGVSGKLHDQGNRVMSEGGLGNEWSQYDFNCTTRGDESEIRFELNITGPGTLWIDGVDVQEVEGS